MLRAIAGGVRRGLWDSIRNFHDGGKPLFDVGEGQQAFSLMSPPLGSPAARRRAIRILKDLARHKGGGVKGAASRVRRSPHWTSVAVSYDCQCDCRHCSAHEYREEVSRSGSALSTPELCRAIGDAVDLGTTSVLLVGGEPLLHPDLETLIGAVDRSRSVCTIFTNGEFLEKADLVSLRKAGLYGVYVSLDFPDSERHDENRRRRGLYEKAVGGLPRCRAGGIATGISTFVSPEKLRSGEVQAMMELARSLGVLEVFFFDIIPTGRLRDEGSCIMRERDFQDFEKLRRAFEAQPGYPRIIHQTMFGGISNPCTGEGCPGGISYMHIRGNGDISPCDFTPLSFGNIRQRSVAEIWREMSGSELYAKPSRRCRMSTPAFLERLGG